MKKADRFKLFCRIRTTVMSIVESFHGLRQIPRRLLLPIRYAISRLPYIPLHIRKFFYRPVQFVRSLGLPLRFAFYRLQFFPRFVRFVFRRLTSLPTRLRLAFRFRAEKVRRETVDSLRGLPEDMRLRKRQILIRWAQKTTKIGAVALVILGSAGAVGKWVALPMYRDWREEKLLGDARRFLDEEDYRGAILTVHQVLRANYGNLEAHRLMVKIGVALDTPESLEFQERVARMEPTRENVLAWSRLALDLGHADQSREALEALRALAPEDPEYFLHLAEDHRLRNQPAEAAAVYERLLAKNPGHARARFELAAVRASNPVVFSQLRRFAGLERLTEDPDVGLEARRMLVLLKASEEDWMDALYHADKLLDHPDAAFSERVLCGRVYAAAGFPRGRELLRSLKAEAADEVEDVFNLAGALIESGEHHAAESWLTSLPAEIKAEWQVKFRLAECLVAREAWPELESSLRNANWDALDFARHMFMRRALLEIGRPAAAEEEWRLALGKGAADPNALRGMYQQVRDWGWERESLDILRRLLERHPRERWAAVELNQRALQTGRTAELRAVFEFLYKVDPLNLKARNDLARINLLLGRDLSRAHSMAEEMHALAPLDADYAATVALSRHLRGRHEEGIQALETIDRANLREHPAAGLYYGMLLSAVGRREEAREFWHLADQVALTPEELRLLSQAGAPVLASSS